MFTVLHSRTSEKEDKQESFLSKNCRYREREVQGSILANMVVTSFFFF